MLILVHHGDAVSEDIDTQRPLSARGLASAERLAAIAASRGVRPDSVWHSGKLRTRQTAEAFWRLCNPAATFVAARGLQPTDSACLLRDAVAGDASVIVAVGHFPMLPRALSLLTTGVDSSIVPFPTHGMVALEATDTLSWHERWRVEDEA